MRRQDITGVCHYHLTNDGSLRVYVNSCSTLRPSTYFRRKTSFFNTDKIPIVTIASCKKILLLTHRDVWTIIDIK